MIAFKKEGKFIYLADSKNAITHFVPIVNWEMYLAKRFNMPRLCKIYDTIEDAVCAAEESLFA